MGIEILILNLQNKIRPEKKYLEWVIKKTVKKNFPGFSPVEIGLVLVNNRQIREINRYYRKVDRVTDVIAFPSSRNFNGSTPAKVIKLNRAYGGDIFISVEKARSQAAEYGSTYKNEIALLLVHGILHVFNYDHTRKKEAAEMERKERETLKWLKT